MKSFKFNGATILIVAMSVLCVSNATFAETQAVITNQNQATITDDGLGVELRFDGTGQLLSLKSTFRHPVAFPDRQGINKAYIIAEEKAKANIARYMNQVVTSSRITTEIDEGLSKSSRSRNSAGETWSKDNTRNVTESLKEITTSQSVAVLRGIRILERTYDEKSEEVKVVVGINRESQAGAGQLGKGLSDNSTGAKKLQEKGNFPAIGSESKRSSDASKF